MHAQQNSIRIDLTITERSRNSESVIGIKGAKRDYTTSNIRIPVQWRKSRGPRSHYADRLYESRIGLQRISGGSSEHDRAKNHETPPAFQSKGPKRYRIAQTLEQWMKGDDSRERGAKENNPSPADNGRLVEPISSSTIRHSPAPKEHLSLNSSENGTLDAV
jgi:hypothetical protein